MPVIGGTDVPQQYVSDVENAASALGIPASVVAAQINDESGFDPTAVSSAGAEGIAQFEPGTFAEYGSGSPDNVSDAFAAYTAYMGALLKQFGGNISEALAAYNAGPDNLAAGAGYASTILGNSGSDATKSTGTKTTAGTTPNNANAGSAGTAGAASSAGTTPTTSGSPTSQTTTNQGQSAITSTGGWDPLSLLGDITGLARDLATVIDYVFGMFGRGQAWRLAMTLVFAAAVYGSYRALVATGAIPDLTPKLSVV
jgi:Transglycosylase SLT domain